MPFIVTYTLILGFNALICLGLAGYIFISKGFRGRIIIGLLMIALMMWAASAAISMHTNILENKILFLKLAHLGIVVTGPLFLIFALKFLQLDKPVKTPHQFLYWFLPVACLIMVWTNEQHGLVWQNIEKVQVGKWSILNYNNGPVLYIIAVYSYIFLVSAATLLIQRAFKLPKIYRKQAFLLALSMIFPLLGNIIFVARLVPLPGYDFAPFFFTISCIIIILSLFRYKFLDVLPIARDTLFRELKDGIILTDNLHRIIDFNDNIEKFLMQKPTIGTSLAEYFHEWNNYNSEIDAEKGLKIEIFNTIRNQKKWWELLVSPIRDKDKLLSGYLLVFQDINERKLSVEKLRESEIKLRELVTVKDTFFNIMAHDLRNPFHTILGFSRILNNDYDNIPEEQKRQYIKNIYQSSDNTYKLIVNLLDWSRLQSGRIEFKPEVLHFEDAIKEEIELARNIALRKNVMIDIKLDKGLNVLADRNMIRSIMRNLLSNAMKFSYHNGFIQVAGRKANSRNVLISVNDKGVGMSADQLSNLFRLDKKSVTKGTDSEPGTGIGLILTKEFVEKNQGSIWADSSPGNGSTFYFTLPFMS